ncbi:hypothetical protein ACFL23_00450 [Patescibacteria group bacterium]
MRNDFKSPYHELSDDKLNRGYWFVSHKIFLKRLTYFILFFLFFVLILFNIYRLINYYTTGQKKYEYELQKLYSQQMDYERLNKIRAPQNIRMGEIKIINSGKEIDDKNYNLIANIENPNKKFKITFDYQFTASGKPLNKYSSFILPGQKKILFDFKSNVRGAESIKIILDNLKYNRISPEISKDPVSFTNEHLIFDVQDVNLTQIETKNSFSKITFNLTNNTAYNYWEPGINVILYKNKTIIGVDYILLKELRSGETIPLSVNWYNQLPSTIKLSVIPNIDIFNPNGYIDFTGEQEGIGR